MTRIIVVLALIAIAVMLPFPLTSLHVIGQEQEYIVKVGWCGNGIDSLNPLIGWTEASWAFYGLIYDALYSPDENLTSQPNLAVSCEVLNENKTLWRYHLNENAKWHDGVSFTADDVVFTINYFLTEDIYMFDSWVGYPDLSFILDVTKVDNYTVDIQFQYPWPALYNALNFPIFPKHIWEEISPEEAQSTYENSNPIGTGPFKAGPELYNDWLQGESVTLYKNPNYHLGAPEIDGVQFVFYNDMSVMVEALKRGDIDVAWVSPDAYVYLTENPPPNIETLAGLMSTSYWTDIGFNMDETAESLNPLRLDWNVRAAIAHAINKTYIVERYYRGLAVEGSGLISPNIPFYHYEPTSEEKLEYNITLANEILDESGYTWTGTHGESVRAAGPENPYAPEGTTLEFDIVVREGYTEEQQIALYVAEECRKIGVYINIYVVDEDTLIDRIYSSDVDMFIYYWADPPDPTYLLSLLTSHQVGVDSDVFWSDPEYDELWIEQLQTTNLTKRQELVRECQRIAYGAYAGKGIPYIILAYLYQTLAWRTDKFEGWPTEWEVPNGKDLSHCWYNPPFFMDLTPKVSETPAPPQRQWYEDPMYIGVLIVVVIVIITAGLLLWKRKKK